LIPEQILKAQSSKVPGTLYLSPLRYSRYICSCYLPESWIRHPTGIASSSLIRQPDSRLTHATGSSTGSGRLRALHSYFYYSTTFKACDLRHSPFTRPFEAPTSRQTSQLHVFTDRLTDRTRVSRRRRCDLAHELLLSIGGTATFAGSARPGKGTTEVRFLRSRGKRKSSDDMMTTKPSTRTVRPAER
jgi:hypothetical protein